jgi:hypothetical protein
MAATSQAVLSLIYRSILLKEVHDEIDYAPVAGSLWRRGKSQGRGEGT